LARLVFKGGYFGSEVGSLGGGDEFGDKAGLESKKVLVERGARATVGSFELGTDAFLFDDVRGDVWLGGTGSEFEVLEGSVFVQDRGDSLIEKAKVVIRGRVEGG
jgi:hypothetical protein